MTDKQLDNYVLNTCFMVVDLYRIHETELAAALFSSVEQSIRKVYPDKENYPITYKFLG